MMEAVHRYEGTVNQMMGDGIMALFGAPIATKTTPSARANSKSLHRLRLHRKRRRLVSSCSKASPCSTRCIISE